jgi:hypothetical protein
MVWRVCSDLLVLLVLLLVLTQVRNRFDNGSASQPFEPRGDWHQQEQPFEVPAAVSDQAATMPEASERDGAAHEASDRVLASGSAGQPALGTIMPPKSTDQGATLYERAGRRFGVSAEMLQALHLVESTGAADSCVRNLEGSGATGPFQFMPSTFRTYGLDADGDGRASICSLADSLFSAAHYLRALGADADPTSGATLNALRAYGTDALRVRALSAIDVARLLPAQPL